MKILRIDELVKPENKKPAEITHIMGSNNGWGKTNTMISNDFINIVYLGKCSIDGDCFACYSSRGIIQFCKGFLNDGFIEQ